LVFVSNDTGTMHMASALGTRVLALFGPTSQDSFGPIGDQSYVLQGQAHCSPCYPYPTCDLKECLAMDNISPRQVIESLSAMLAVRKGASMVPVSSLGVSGMPATTFESEF
jgi:ADP-heptose:LPS heptosyltransferase